MEIAKIILEYIKVLIWPAFAFTFIFIFKKAIGDLLKKVSKAKLPGGIEINIDHELEKAKENEPSVIKEHQEKIQEKKVKIKPNTKFDLSKQKYKKYELRDSPSNLDLQYYLDIAETDYILALAGLRMEIEVIINNLAKRYNLFHPRGSMSMMAKDLLREYKITQHQYDLINSISRICNAAVHGGDVRKHQALEVIDLAKVLLEDYIAWLDWGFRD